MSEEYIVLLTMCVCICIVSAVYIFTKNKKSVTSIQQYDFLPTKKFIYVAMWVQKLQYNQPLFACDDLKELEAKIEEWRKANRQFRDEIIYTYVISYQFS